MTQTVHPRRPGRTRPSKSAAPTSRRADADVQRASAIAAVVLLHCASPAVGNGALDPAVWGWANGFDAACRWCVPVFVMISGALLLDSGRAESVFSFYYRRLGRIGLPTLFWSVFYLIWRRIAYGEQDDARAVAGLLIRGEPYFHMYFLFVMFGLYLVTPPLRLLNRLAPFLLAIVATVALTLAAVVTPPWRDQTILTRFIPFVGYYLAGAALVRQRLSPAWRWPSLLVAVAAAVLIIFSAAAAHDRGDSAGLARAYDYFNPLVMLLSLSVFCFATSWLGSRGLPNHVVGQTIGSIAAASLGIYLIHPFLMDLLQWRGVPFSSPSQAWFIPLDAAIVFLFAWLCVHTLRQVPGLSLVFG